MSHRLSILALLAGCAVENKLAPVGTVAASSSALDGAEEKVHVGMDGAACAFPTTDDGSAYDLTFTDGERPVDVAVFDVRAELVLLTLDGVLSELDAYTETHALGVADVVVDAAYTDDGWVALTEDCRLLTPDGAPVAAPGCGRLETHDGAVWLRGRGTMWPIDGGIAGEGRTMRAMITDADGGTYEAHEGEIVGPSWTAGIDAVALFRLRGGIGAQDTDGQVWRLDPETGEAKLTRIDLQPGSIVTSDDGRVLVHQTPFVTTWYAP